MDSTLERHELRNYVIEEYKLDCKLRFLLEKFSIEAIVDEVIRLLRESDLNFIDITAFARDFYIGSDLTNQEKHKYITEMKQQAFFQLLDTFLYSDNYSICSWTIYTIGKFSEHENAIFLEIAYETKYKEANPILAYRCLNELTWLQSEKVENYICELEKSNAIKANLILLYYFESLCDNEKFNDMLKQEDIMNLLALDKTLSCNKDIASKRLFALENHIAWLCSNNKTISFTESDISIIT
ncbi:MAG: hypothetical protein FWE32_10340 [Oscillospiraceae bacterium]|nr:hypothetical protein [Oscillospiraceae bacterium]